MSWAYLLQEREPLYDCNICKSFHIKGDYAQLCYTKVLYEVISIYDLIKIILKYLDDDLDEYYLDFHFHHFINNKEPIYGDKNCCSFCKKRN